MFREMRRFKQSLPKEEIEEILEKEKRGTLAVNGDDGYPYAIPIDFWYDPTENKVFFHSATAGYKTDAMNRCDKVCLTVCEQGVQKEDWSYHARSVVLFGRAKPVEEEARKREKAKRFALKYYPSEEEVEEELEKDFWRVAIWEISVEHATGKRVHEK